MPTGHPDTLRAALSLSVAPSPVGSGAGSEPDPPDAPDGPHAATLPVEIRIDMTPALAFLLAQHGIVAG